MTTTRIYIITRKGADHRLIRASSRAQAVSHAVGTDYAAEVASQEALVGLLGSGVTVESAGTSATNSEPQA